MAKALRYVVTALRVLVAAVCVPLLAASLVLWPRSHFYSDHFEIPADNNRPGRLYSTAEPGMSYTANAILFSSGYGAIKWFGPDVMIVSGPEMARPWSHRSERSPPFTTWKPSIGRYKRIFSTGSGTFHVTAPYWLPTSIALLGLAIAFPRTALSLFSRRVGISSLLFAMFSVALLISLYRLARVGGVVLGGEAIALLWIARRAWIVGAKSERWTRWGAYAIIVLCFLGLATIAAFTFHVTGASRFFLDRPVTEAPQ